MSSVSSELNDNLFPAQNFPCEKRSLNEINSTKRTDYDTLAKSQIHPILYIQHKLEHGETIQRLALKYSVNIQEIKRVNKLWSDSELGLLLNVLIPVSTSQLAILKTTLPALDIVQTSSPISSHRPQELPASNEDDNQSAVSSSISITSFDNKEPPYQDYFSKIDQQIRASKKSLQTLDTKHARSRMSPSSSSSSSRVSVSSSLLGDEEDSSLIPHNARSLYPSAGNENTNSQHHRPYRKSILSNDIFVNISQSKSRSKQARAALERIQREKEDIYEL